MKASKHRMRRLSSIITVIVILVIGSGLAYAMNSGMKKLPIRKYFSQTHTNAVWDWGNIHNRTNKDLQEMSDFMYKHQINTVYVDISSYGDVLSLPASQRSSKEADFYDSIERYVKVLGERNIRVFAAAGHTDWSKRNLQEIPLAIQQFVYDYNQSSDHNLAGIEFDIESYNQSHFEAASFTEKGLVLAEFLDTVDLIASAHSAYINKTGDKEMELGFAIPYWFDNQNKNIKSVTWKDKTGPTLFHILDRLNELPKTNVVVMAYRNAALGNDGMIYHARTEMDYAQSKAKNVQVQMGIEVNKVEPEKITFYGRSYTEVSSEVSQLYAAFEQNKNFGGIAINDLAGYMQMNQATN